MTMTMYHSELPVLFFEVSTATTLNIAEEVLESEGILRVVGKIAALLCHEMDRLISTRVDQQGDHALLAIQGADLLAASVGAVDCFFDLIRRTRATYQTLCVEPDVEVFVAQVFFRRWASVAPSLWA